MGTAVHPLLRERDVSVLCGLRGPLRFDGVVAAPPRRVVLVSGLLPQHPVAARAAPMAGVWVRRELLEEPVVHVRVLQPEHRPQRVLNDALVEYFHVNHQWAWGLTLGATGVLNYFTLRNAFAPEHPKDEPKKAL